MNAPRPIPLRPDRSAVATEWRRSFIRSATATVLGKLQKTSAAEIVRANWPNDSRAAIILRGAVTPTTQDAYPGSSVSRLLLLASRSTASQVFPLATVVDLVGVSAFQYPLASNFADATFIPEGGAIPLRQGAFVGMPVGPVRKLGLLAALSSELESASGGIAETIISHTLEVAVGRGLDAILFSANAATDDAPAGLLFGTVAISGSADMAKDLGALVASISAAGLDASSASIVFVASARQTLSIMLTSGPNFNYRVIASNAVPDGTVICVCVAGLVIAGDGGVPQIDIGKQAVLHFADPAAEITPVGGPISAPVLSTFQNDLVALKCVARLTWSAAPKSVAVVNGATW